jgi:hypothetical protein
MVKQSVLCKNILKQGSRSMPNASEKEEQSKGTMTKSEQTAAKNSI